MHGSSGRTLRGLGIALAALGAVSILLPRAGSIATGWMLGLALVVGGMIAALSWMAEPGEPARRRRRVPAALGAAGGACLLGAPEAGVPVLAAGLAGFCLLEGLLYCCVRIGRMSRDGPTWRFGWAFATGTASVSGAASVLAGWPESASWAIGLLVGLKLIASGAALLLFARLVEGVDAPTA